LDKNFKTSQTYLLLDGGPMMVIGRGDPQPTEIQARITLLENKDSRTLQV